MTGANFEDAIVNEGWLQEMASNDPPTLGFIPEQWSMAVTSVYRIHREADCAIVNNIQTFKLRNAG